MRRAAVAIAVGALALAACDPTKVLPDPKAGFDKLTVSVVATVDSAPLFLGKAKGLFDKQKIDLTIAPVADSTAVMSAATGGHAPIGLANTESLLAARAGGTDVKVLSGGAASTGKAGQDFSAILVAADSDAQSAADLAGAKIGISKLKSLGDTTVRASIRKDGGDPTKVKFVDVPFADAYAKLTAGEVEAVWVVEPYLTAAIEQGARPIAWNYADTVPNLTTGMYFTTGKYAEEHADLVRRFTAAMVESLQYATAHESQTRQIVTSYVQVDPGVPGKMVLPKWPTEVNRPSVQRVADLARGDGVLKKSVDVESLLP